MTERGAIYQISFSPNCIWREVVVVEVMTPAEEIGAPSAPNRLVLLVGTTGERKIRVIQHIEELCSELRMKLL